MVKIEPRTGHRALWVYLGLVVVPVVIAIILLGQGEDGDVVAKTEAAAGPPLVQLLLAIAVVVGACKVVGRLAQWIGQPAVIGEITAGVLLGPSVLGALWPSGAAVLIPKATVPQLNVVAQLGVIFFVFLAGLELNTKLLRGRGRLALVVSHVSIALPFLLGVGLAMLAYTRFSAGGGFLPFALFFGVSMSITALPVLVRILHEIGLFRSEIGVVALTCAVVDDVTAWSLLALVIALTTASSLFGVVLTVVLTAAFVALLGLVVRPLLRKFVARAPAARLHRVAPLSVVGVLVCAMATEWIGVHAMFGAFVFGVVFPRDNPIATWLHDKAGGLTTALMLPLFFAYSGLRTDIGLLSGGGAWLWCGAILLVAVAGKFGGSALAARAVGENWNRSLQVGALMNCRGLTELVVLNIGLDLGVLSPALFTMMVIMALVSTAMAAPMATWFARRDGRNVVDFPGRTWKRAAA
ncbi:cation:proton antiporter [Amycolatopsis decaplanina]|uniref:Cation transporter/universal stress family protein n=1 Tax=Amycolatopsis decaplanina DSM 44594 TaxID=1284240 RepID=M2XUT4_9PSEU|nr:cation:proton antiporter [Amycolatopsis decaplanina]EME64716.1 cation transporter/universal stress family protein [Amycolatopsis decaplanina DSM 44594]